MSDFLTNLATRNLRPSEALRPRLPALFEPVAPRGLPALRPAGPDSLAPPEQDPAEVITETSAPPPVRRRTPRAAAPVLPGVELTEDDGAHEPSLSRAEDRVAPQRRAVPPPVAEAPHPVEAARPPMPAPLSQAPPPSPARPPDRAPVPALAAREPRPETTVTHAPPETRSRHIVEEVVQRTVTERLVPIEPAARTTKEGAAQESPTRRKGDRPASGDPPLSPRREAASFPPVAVVAQPQITPYREAPREQEPVTVAPTIHVTIGRVEVRAASATDTRAAYPQRPSQRPSGVMSLEEYLRRRKQGGAE